MKTYSYFFEMLLRPIESLFHQLLLLFVLLSFQARLLLHYRHHSTPPEVMKKIIFNVVKFYNFLIKTNKNLFKQEFLN